MADRERLEIEIEASGMVTGRRVAVRELDEIRKASGNTGTGIAKLDRIVDLFGSGTLKMAGVVGIATVALGGFLAIARPVAATLQQGVRDAAIAEQSQRQLAAAVESTGGAAGFTVRELAALSTELQRLTTYDDETIQGAEAILLTFTKIGREALPGATLAVLDIATRMKTDLTSAAIQVGKALNDPKIGLDGLSRSGIQFTQQQKDTIRSLFDTGRAAEGQLLILEELERQFGGSAAAARDSFEGSQIAAKNAVGDLSEELGKGLLPSLRLMTEEFVDIASDQRFLVFVRGVGEAIGDVARTAGGVISAVVSAMTSQLSTVADVASRLFDLIGRGAARAGLSGAASFFGGLSEDASFYGDILAGVSKRAQGLAADLLHLGDAGESAKAGLKPPPVPDLPVDKKALERFQAARDALRFEYQQTVDLTNAQREGVEALEGYRVKYAGLNAVVSLGAGATAAQRKEIEALARIVEVAKIAQEGLAAAEERRIKNAGLASGLRVTAWQQEQQLLGQLSALEQDLGDTRLRSLGLELSAQEKANRARSEFVDGLRETHKEFLLLNPDAMALVDAMGLLVEQTSLLESAAAKAGKEFDEGFLGGALQIGENAAENLQRSFADAFNEIVRYGKFSMDDLFSSVLDLGARTVSELLSQWLTLELQKTLATAREAAKRAAIDLAAAQATGNYGPLPGGGNLSGFGGASSLKSLLGRAAPYIAGAAIAAAPIVIANYLNKNREAKRFDSGAYSTFDSKTGGVSVASGIQNRSSNAARDAISGLWQAFQEGTGAFVTGMAGLTIAVRHDQKAFRVSLGGVVLGTFKDLNQAITTGFKAQFDSAEFSQEIAPAIRDFVSGFSGTAEELVSGIDRIQSEIDAGSGLSDLALEVRGLGAASRQTTDDLARMGVSRADAQDISGMSFIQRFKDFTRQLYNEQLSPEEQLEQARITGEILQAELEMKRADLQARKAFLEGKLAIAQEETQLDLRKFDVDRTMLEARTGFTKGEITLFQAEGEGMQEYLNLRGRFAQRQAEAWKAELEAINKVLSALDGLDIDVGKIKIPSIGKSFGGHVSKFGGLVDRFNRGVANFVDSILGARQDTSTSPLTDRERLQGSFDQYQQLLAGARSGNVAALEQLPQAYRDLLSLAKDFSGGATGLGFLGLGDSFREFFDRLEGGALDFVNAGRPKKLFDGELVVPERFYRGQEQQTKELNERRKEAHTQTTKIAETVERSIDSLKEPLERIRDEMRASRKALSLYDSKRTVEAA